MDNDSDAFDTPFVMMLRWVRKTLRRSARMPFRDDLTDGSGNLIVHMVGRMRKKTTPPEDKFGIQSFDFDSCEYEDDYNSKSQACDKLLNVLVSSEPLNCKINKLSELLKNEEEFKMIDEVSDILASMMVREYKRSRRSKNVRSERFSQCTNSDEIQPPKKKLKLIDSKKCWKVEAQSTTNEAQSKTKHESNGVSSSEIDVCKMQPLEKKMKLIDSKKPSKVEAHSSTNEPQPRKKHNTDGVDSLEIKVVNRLYELATAPDNDLDKNTENQQQSSKYEAQSSSSSAPVGLSETLDKCLTDMVINMRTLASILPDYPSDMNRYFEMCYKFTKIIVNETQLRRKSLKSTTSEEDHQQLSRRKRKNKFPRKRRRRGAQTQKKNCQPLRNEKAGMTEMLYTRGRRANLTLQLYTEDKKNKVRNVPSVGQQMYQFYFGKKENYEVRRAENLEVYPLTKPRFQELSDNLPFKM